MTLGSAGWGANPLLRHVARDLSGVQATFFAADALRRIHGDVLGALGADPRQCPYEEIASGSFWRLRDYGGRRDGPALLVVAAPIKRPYIWDLSPEVSAVRRMRDRLRVYLLEWLPPSRRDPGNGLAEYVRAISACATSISLRTSGERPFVIGHSLGGTLAAIFACASSQSVRGLVLVGAPLCFGPATSSFRDALVSLVPAELPEEGTFPGSLVSHMSAVAAPGTFVWSRLCDAAWSWFDRRAVELHARVDRWALDEVALPGRLTHQLVDWLYRQDRLYRGTLAIDDAVVGPSGLSVPTLAVVTQTDSIAPLASVAPFFRATQTTDVRIIECAGELGVPLQHLVALLGRRAHELVWPEIISWLGRDGSDGCPVIRDGA